MKHVWRVVVGAGLALGGGSVGLSSVSAQSQSGQHQHPPAAATPAPGARVSMEALHAAGGVPPGWRFTLPPGDAGAGRQAFVELKCYACHAIKGERFPLPPGESATAGPELTGMGGHHPPEYLAESIVNPSAVLIEGPGYIGGDGRSIMPSYPDMTLAQLVNLVAYLRTLGAPDPHHAHEPAREQTVGGYRVRLAYRPADGSGDAHSGHGAAVPAPPTPGRLTVFVSDPGSGQSIPYLPVRGRIEVPGKPPQAVTLRPALGAEGFHYAADIALPAETKRITLLVGPTSIKLGPCAPQGLRRAQTMTFNWK